MTVTRNDPCPCGSGRKYKHCCLARQAAAPTELSAALWRRVRRELDGFPDRMLRFVLDAYGDGAFDEAWAAFGASAQDWPDFDPATELAPVFLPWMYHAWSPDPAATAVADPTLHGVPPTRAWLARKGRHADRELVRYLEGCLRERFGFHEVMDCDPGVGLVARSLWDDASAKVLEASASHSLAVGDMIYGQLVPVGDFRMMEACASRVFRPADRAEAIGLVRRLVAHRAERPPDADRDALRDTEDRAVRRHLLGVLERMDRPTELRNTDGDLLAPQTLHFRIASPRDAFAALSVLDVIGAERSRQLAPRPGGDPGDFEIGFDWSCRGNAIGAGWDNTVLGRFKIVGHSLSLDVNSDERAALGRELVEKALGAQVEYLRTQRRPTPAPRGGAQVTLSTTALDADTPEAARQAVADMLEKHYANWPDMPLPALGGRTPLQAVAEPTGRAMVAALVDQIERGSGKGGPTLAGAVIERLRARLGL